MVEQSLPGPPDAPTDSRWENFGFALDFDESQRLFAPFTEQSFRMISGPYGFHARVLHWLKSRREAKHPTPNHATEDRQSKSAAPLWHAFDQIRSAGPFQIQQMPSETLNEGYLESYRRHAGPIENKRRGRVTHRVTLRRN